MGELHTTIIEMSMAGAAVVAKASGQKPDDKRWTELTLYKAPADQTISGMAGPFVAEIVGETLIEGEERRVKRGAFRSLAKALNWSAFDNRSALYSELRTKALDWMEAQARDVSAGGSGSGLVPIRCMGGAGGAEQPMPAGQTKPRKARGSYGKVEIELRFAAPGALSDLPHCVSVTWFNEDGGVGARTRGEISRQYGGCRITAELPENSR